MPTLTLAKRGARAGVPIAAEGSARGAVAEPVKYSGAPERAPETVSI